MVSGANMGPTWGWQDPGSPQVGLVNLDIWVVMIMMFIQIWCGRKTQLNNEYYTIAWGKMLWWQSSNITWSQKWHNIDGLVQERHNSTANALGLHLSCTNSSILGKCYKEVLGYNRTFCHMSRRFWKLIHFIGTLLICSDWPISSWRLQMVWHKRGTRPSKTMKIWLWLVSHGTYHKNIFCIISIKQTLHITGW